MPKPAAERTELARKENKASLRAIFPRNKYYLQLLALVLIIAGIIVVALVADEAKPKPKPKATSNSQASACGPYRRDVAIRINGQTFNTEQAKSTKEFAKGLGGRPCILPDQAMMFAFSKPGHYSFWMKDMNFPIDIVWISSDHRVAGLEIDVKPSTYPDRFINKDNLAQYVLEIQANRSKDLHIDLGTPVSF